METNSFITFRVEGIHSWPEAPTELRYLRDPHRHSFNFKISFPQEKDRGIEFHQFKQYVEEVLRKSYGRTGPHAVFIDFQDKSCEAIAQSLVRALLMSTRFYLPYVVVQVSEDGEFGSSVMASKLEFID